MDEVLFWLLAVSWAQVVEAPRPAENSWATSSTRSLLTEAEKVTLMVEDPVVVTGPIHSSSSTTSVESVCWVSLVHVVAPPPATDVAVMVPEDTLTDRTSTSPTCAGDTARVVMPVLWALA